MKTSIEFLTDLIGKTQVEKILQDYVRKNFSSGGGSMEDKPKHRRKYFPMGTKRWTPEEDQALAEKAKILRSTGLGTRATIRELAIDFPTRTKSALGGRLWKIEHPKF